MWPVFLWQRQDVAVIKPKGYKQSGDSVEHQTPRQTYAIAKIYLQITYYHDQYALSENRCQTVKCTADAHKIGLFVLIKPQHIKTVCGDVMCCATECNQEEQSKSGLKPKTGRYRKSHTSQSSSYQNLHRQNPPPLSFQDVYKRTP